MWKKVIALTAVVTSLWIAAGGVTTYYIHWLDESHKEFLAAIDGLSEEQWKWKPAPNRWSVGETAEHIVLAEASLFANVQKAVASPANPEYKNRCRKEGKSLRIPGRSVLECVFGHAAR